MKQLGKHIAVIAAVIIAAMSVLFGDPIAQWLTPEPEQCALCAHRNDAPPFLASAIINLATGDVCELQMYQRDFHDLRKLAQEQQTGAFRRLNFDGALAYADVGEACHVIMTDTKLFAPYFAMGAAIVNISSSHDRMSQPQTESYTAAKGGISALTHALAVSLAGKVRVNSISPGWIDTEYQEYTGPDAAQQPVGRVGNPLDIANMVLYLCSDRAGFITGENICIGGGMTKLMIYHNDNGWKFEE